MGDTPNTSSWLSSQPKDEPLKLKAVQSLKFEWIILEKWQFKYEEFICQDVINFFIEYFLNIEAAWDIAVACCRGCISKWHGIEKGRAMSEAEIDYIVALIMGWIEYKTKKVSTRKP